ncbi:MAG: efflux RND transporter permease subunit [Planctomycetia bacterium]|nr:efflux RND transporter permease subunit [Planctomycetia bacterium]
MFSRFFIDRPIFAAVLSIVMTIAGGVAVLTLPVAQYPEIAPPTVQVSCTYPGASAVVVAETVAAPIEQQVNGVERMLYMSSQCTNDGAYNLTVTFELGTNLDMAQVLVQNRVSMALPTLPDIVKQTGVTTKKKSPNIMLVVNLTSPDGRYDQLYLSNYATINIKDTLARIKGVGDVTFLGQQDYSMRLWLDADRLKAFNLTSGDVVKSLREQNVQVAAGQIGQPPVPSGLSFQYTMTTLGRLVDPERFADIIVKTGDSGQTVRVRDVARVELGAKSQDQTALLDGKPTVGLAVFQLPGSNAVATAEVVRKTMEHLKAEFPDGLQYSIVYDTTPFIEESIHEVYKTLFEAIILVAIVVMVFLQNWRSVIIPLIAVPVSLVGTFAVMAMLGFSLNNISLLGLVLAIGVVVDDAIVVVENVERWIGLGLPPKEAAYKSMEEVTVAVIAIAFGLSAVFIPTAFISGMSGQFYRQFALTIATSTLISAFNSLTLSPALAAILLKPHGAKKDPLTKLLDTTLGWFFRGFNKSFDATTNFYERLVKLCLRGAVIGLAVYVGLLFLTYKGFTTVPTGFVPAQDKGYLLISAQLPDSSSLERTQHVMRRVDEIVKQVPGVAHRIVISGQSFLLNANGSNFGSMYVVLDEFHHRHGKELGADHIASELRKKLYVAIPEAQIGVFGAPPVDGVGNAGGFKIMVKLRGGGELKELQGQVDNLTEKANAQPQLVGVFSMFRANTPQLYLDIDRTKCKTMGVALNDVFDSLQVYLGGYYVNDFNQFDRTWQVNLQADAKFRIDRNDIQKINVRNTAGQMVPLSAVATVEDSSGPVLINRYQNVTAATINGSWKPGVSSGQAMTAMEGVAARELPGNMSTEWTELSYQEKTEGNTAIYIFPLCILFVFLTHAAEYESWTLPLAIILIVPMSLLCALAGAAYRGMDNNIFTQIGFVVLAGLACKNAVLIVEFAKQNREQGTNRFDAAVIASKLRLRPIMMTSFAFILGVVPLMLATGAGAEMRQTLGTSVFAGMLGVTFFGIFLTPIFYFVLQTFSEWWSPHSHHAPHQPPSQDAAHAPSADHTHPG